MTIFGEIYHHLTGKPICTEKTVAAGSALAAALPDGSEGIKNYRTKLSGKIIRGRGLLARLVAPPRAKKAKA